MKRILAILAVVALVVSPVIADDAVAPATPAPAHKSKEAKELTLKGKIAKTMVADKAVYTLTTAYASVVLPAPKDGIKDDLLNVDVVVVAKGHETKDGKKIMVKEVVSVTKDDMKKAPAAVPAAPVAK